MQDFREIMREQQVKWRENYLPHIKENGWQNGKQYNHILPRKYQWQNFYSEIREELEGYLKKNAIHPHTSIHNLLSSWAMCANLYWPFKNADGLKVFAKYLSTISGIEIDKIETMELEYAEEDLSPQKLLGEDEGMRGTGQTSPDLAVKFLTRDRRKGIFLIESKFTEHSFYSCSGYNKTKPGKPVNPDKRRCHRPDYIAGSDFKECHLIAWGRKYWDLLKDLLNYEKFSSLKMCPMSRSCYQLFRQQALAKGYESKYEISISCVAVDHRNEDLINSSVSVGLKPFPQGWREIFPDLQFLWLTHKDWFDFVKSNNRDGKWNDWLAYIENRYFNI